MSIKISLSVKFIVQPSFFHSFISEVSSTMEFSNSSTLVHHNKNRPLTGLFFMLQILCKSKIIEPNGEIYG